MQPKRIALGLGRAQMFLGPVHMKVISEGLLDKHSRLLLRPCASVWSRKSLAQGSARYFRPSWWLVIIQPRTCKSGWGRGIYRFLVIISEWVTDGRSKWVCTGPTDIASTSIFIAVSGRSGEWFFRLYSILRICPKSKAFGLGKAAECTVHAHVISEGPINITLTRYRIWSQKVV